MLRAPKPAAPKKRKRGEDEKERSGFIRKHMLRLFRKTWRRMREDCRDLPPTFDSLWWHRHQQSTAELGRVHDQGIRQAPHAASALTL
jgi:hypothetical protein